MKLCSCSKKDVDISQLIKIKIPIGCDANTHQPNLDTDILYNPNLVTQKV